jgi:hypothetical protein
MRHLIKCCVDRLRPPSNNGYRTELSLWPFFHSDTWRRDLLDRWRRGESLRAFTTVDDLRADVRLQRRGNYRTS